MPTPQFIDVLVDGNFGQRIQCMGDWADKVNRIILTALKEPDFHCTTIELNATYKQGDVNRKEDHG